MARKTNQNIFALLSVPWWASLIAAPIGFAAFRFAIPPLASGNPFLGTLGSTCFRIAPYIAAMLASMAPLAFVSRRLLDGRTGMASIRAMDRQNFELLVAQGFRRLGYSVEQLQSRSADGDIGIELHKDGNRTLVQCRHWREKQIGVAPLRELYAVLASEKAEGALLVTSGTFTSEAQAFAKDKPIGLVDGAALLELVQWVQTAHRERITPAAPACPVCERPMAKRKAEKGSTIGTVFWGCTAYPSCMGTRAL